MAKSLVERCPFREGSASHKIFVVLAKAAKPMRAEHIAKAAKVPVEKTATLLAAYKNPFHNAPLRRAGVSIESKAGQYVMATVKADPNAKRPERGQGKKRKPAKKLTTPKPAKAKKPAPHPVTPDTAPNSNPDLPPKGD